MQPNIRIGPGARANLAEVWAIGDNALYRTDNRLPTPCLLLCLSALPATNRAKRNFPACAPGAQFQFRFGREISGVVNSNNTPRENVISPSGCVVFMACARVVLGLSLLFRLRREDHVHLFAVQIGHRLDFGELFQIGGET